MTHPSNELLQRYVSGESDAVAPDVWWAVEAHMESCAGCRSRLAATVAVGDPVTAALVEQVRVHLAAEVVRSPRMPARPRVLPRWVRWWATPAVLQRLVMTALVMLAAIGLDLADAAGRYPSLVLLLAPAAPLLGVAATWSRGLDPAHELVVASPRAGLDLVLRRSLAVLAAVIPVLAVAGGLVGASPARWLLPCLALTAGSLALGELVGLHRAATGLAIGWVAVVVGPSLAAARTPVLLDPAAGAAWAAATAVAAVVLVVLVMRRRAYTALASGR